MEVETKIKITTFEDLINMAICVDRPLTVCNDTQTLQVTPESFEHFDNGYYEVMSGVLGFKNQGAFYCIPYSRNSEAILIKKGFWHRGLYFPFTFDCAIPEYSDKWQEARSMVLDGRL